MGEPSIDFEPLLWLCLAILGGEVAGAVLFVLFVPASWHFYAGVAAGVVFMVSAWVCFGVLFDPFR